MRMPILQPLPIRTKGAGIFVRGWRWFTNIRKWKVVEEYSLSIDGVHLVIPPGFVFDGASIPRAFWSVLSPTGLLLIPGLFHDYSYRHDFLWRALPGGHEKWNEGAGKVFWDKLFMRIGKQVNGVYFANYVAWLALFVGGFGAWKHNRNLGYDRHPAGRGETPE